MSKVLALICIHLDIRSTIGLIFQTLKKFMTCSLVIFKWNLKVLKKYYKLGIVWKGRHILSSTLTQGFKNIDWVKNIDNQWYTLDIFCYYLQEH